MKFGDKIKQLRLRKNMTQEEFADLLGTSKQVISRYETNQRTPKITVAKDYADRLGIPVDFLLDDTLNTIPSNIISMPDMHEVPLIGNIACGSPILAEENIEFMLRVPNGIRADFALRCWGDSMINARIFDGDIVFIRKQEDVHDGEIAAVLIDDDATLKRVYHTADGLLLRAENPTFPSMVITEGSASCVRILGKAVAFMSDVR